MSHFAGFARASISILALLLFLLPAAARGADGSDLVITVETSQSEYAVGEVVDIEVSLCNPTDEPIFVNYGCPCCYFDVSILDSSGSPVSQDGIGCILVLDFESWEPGECILEEYEWEQLEPLFYEGGQVEEGYYSVLYQWTSFAPTVSAEARSPAFLVGDAVTVPTLSGLGSLVLAVLMAAVGVRRLARRGE